MYRKYSKVGVRLERLGFRGSENLRGSQPGLSQPLFPWELGRRASQEGIHDRFRSYFTFTPSITVRLNRQDGSHLCNWWFHNCINDNRLVYVFIHLCEALDLLLADMLFNNEGEAFNVPVPPELSRPYAKSNIRSANS